MSAEASRTFLARANCSGVTFSARKWVSWAGLGGASGLRAALAPAQQLIQLLAEEPVISQTLHLIRIPQTQLTAEVLHQLDLAGRGLPVVSILCTSSRTCPY